MRLSKLLTGTSKTAPADEPSRNAQLLIRAGFINKEMAGVYSFLPLGLIVLSNIANIIREEMNSIGGQEILMPALQVKERYELSGRWDDKVVDDWFKTKLVNGTEVGLGFSHEENLSPILKSHLRSYKNLPLAIYQIQTKFRNEKRSKSGLLRGREFLMKDMYTFAISQEQHEEIYNQVKEAYLKIFDRFGIGDKTFLTSASGGSFSKFSHEFQTLCSAGEDTIYLDRSKKIAINKEIYTDEIIADHGLNKNQLEEVKSIEVGNIFSLGTKFSKPFELTVNDEKGSEVTLIMGCYGIGVSRMMGTIAEVLSDDNGLVWPKNIAPAQLGIVSIGQDSDVISAANELYESLKKSNLSVIFDDRDINAGEKFADIDLIGLPYRVVVSKSTLPNKKFELKSRTSTEVEFVSQEELINRLASD